MFFGIFHRDFYLTVADVVDFRFNRSSVSLGFKPFINHGGTELMKVKTLIKYSDQIVFLNLI